MPVLYYVGATAQEGLDVESLLSAQNRLNTGVSQGWVRGEVARLSSVYATKTYVKTQDDKYVDDDYPPVGDANLVPVTDRGQPHGVASLDATGKIPIDQVPVLGAGTLNGPFGCSNVKKRELVGSVWMTIADVFTGSPNGTGVLLPYMLVKVSSTGGRPVVEVRVGTEAQTTYASQTLIGAGRGRSHYSPREEVESSGVQMIPVVPVTRTPTKPPYAPGTKVLVQAWLHDEVPGCTSTFAEGGIVSSAFYVAKTHE